MNIENNMGANDSNRFEVVASTWVTDKTQIRDENAGRTESPKGANEIILPAYAINPQVLSPEILKKLKDAHRTRLTERASALRNAANNKNKDDNDRTI